MGSARYDNEDSFLSEDEEELCPLCVEEMDISDRNFKPCPCGYQVCQFCYNNIRQNPQLNGKCPACRRPYDDESVEYRPISPEEWKREHAKQARKERERKQREREKKETELTSKKHLSGMRVIQKNLVYVIGLNPNIPTEELHHTLRSDSFFGQYGKIQKIVVNRRNNSNGNPGIGVYVTFARKEDAAKCIRDVDGSLHEGKYLKAAYGTTKYCSSYLRGQTCPNPNCMFLHEPGEEADSYNRQELSTYQHDQSAKEKSVKHTPKPNHATPVNPVSESIHYNPAPTNDVFHGETSGPALPPTASWATKASPSVSAAKINQPSFPPLPSAKVPTPSTPSSATAGGGTESTIIYPQREAPKVDPALKFMEDSLSMLSARNYDYQFSKELFSAEKFEESLPYFAFSGGFSGAANNQTQSVLKELPPYVFATISFTARPDLFRPIDRPLPSLQSQQQIPQQQTSSAQQPHQQGNVSNPVTQLLDKIDGMKIQTPPPPPPPGLYTAASGTNNGTMNSTPSQNSTELLARLMKRDTSGEAQKTSF